MKDGCTIRGCVRSKYKLYGKDARMLCRKHWFLYSREKYKSKVVGIYDRFGCRVDKYEKKAYNTNYELFINSNGKRCYKKRRWVL